ncbi:hypothetical protein FRC03_005217 [Tulasnella sp. 419]|nr:hypothetical protein FRC03_005217 [Tulasnella sp. 419]
MFFCKVAARSPVPSPTTTQSPLVMADARILTTSPIIDFDDYPYNSDGNSSSLRATIHQ